MSALAYAQESPVRTDLMLSYSSAAFLSSPQNPKFPRKLLKTPEKYRRRMWRVFPPNLLRLK